MTLWATCPQRLDRGGGFPFDYSGFSMSSKNPGPSRRMTRVCASWKRGSRDCYAGLHGAGALGAVRASKTPFQAEGWHPRP